MTTYVEPGEHLLSFIAADAGGLRMFSTAILYDGQLFATTDLSGQWKVFHNDTITEPEGWNTQLDFDDASWTSATVACDTTHLQSLNLRKLKYISRSVNADVQP